MPEMNGYELVRMLRQRSDTRLRIIAAMTANGDESSEFASLEAGFDWHFTKPFQWQLILRLFTDPRVRKGKDHFA